MTMKIETPIIAILLAGLMFTGFFTIFSSMASEYNVPMDLTSFTTKNQSQSLEEGLNRINETKTEMDQIGEDFANTKLTGGELGGLFTFLKLGFTIGKSIYNNMFLFTDLIRVMAEIIGIPASIITTFISIVIFVLVVSIVLLLLGRTYAQ